MELTIYKLSYTLNILITNQLKNTIINTFGFIAHLFYFKIKTIF